MIQNIANFLLRPPSQLTKSSLKNHSTNKSQVLKTNQP